MGKAGRLFIIGAMRSGTTYCATVLDEHPEICMHKPILDEPKYFIREDEFRKGVEYYEKNYFHCGGDEKFIGEKTVHYCEHEKAAARIKEWYPDAKIIMILRDPVYRAISNYYFSRKNGLETRSMEEVFLKEVLPPDYDRERLLISPFNYLERGKYLNQIELYEKYFPGEQMKILLMEKFVGNLSEISGLYEFLNVTPDVVPGSLRIKIHEGKSRPQHANPRIIQKLKSFYSHHNMKLGEKLGIKLDTWE